MTVSNRSSAARKVAESEHVAFTLLIIRSVNASDLRKLALSLPGSTETIQWGDNRVFKVGGKMFAVSGYEPDSLYSFKVDDDRFLELSDQAGMRPAPYLARAKWVQVDVSQCDLPSVDLEDLVKRSYEIIFDKLPKKTQKELS